jgi:putative acetyltransferase
MIRHETPADIAAIHEVTAAAFKRAVEADLVDHLRDADHLLLSLVDEEGGKIVGHAAYSPGRVNLSDGSSFEAVALGPISVSPEVQKKGIGSGLMEQGFTESLNLGYDLMFLLGHPSYYPRFGFVPAKVLGVRWAKDLSDHPNEAWMVKELKADALVRRLQGRTGVFHFAPEFDDAE